jgi:hypothetical protein
MFLANGMKRATATSDIFILNRSFAPVTTRFRNSVDRGGAHRAPDEPTRLDIGINC